MTTVMVVEDDPAFLTRFCKIVSSDAELELFAAVADLASARQAMRTAVPDVLLIDLGLPDGSGIDLIRETARRRPETDIMVITVFGDEDHVLASIEAGATGYILKDSLPAEFVQLIKQLRAGGSPISPVIARQLLKRLKPGRRGRDTACRGDAAVRPRDGGARLHRQGLQLCRDRALARRIAAHRHLAREEDLPEACGAFAGRGGL